MKLYLSRDDSTILGLTHYYKYTGKDTLYLHIKSNHKSIDEWAYVPLIEYNISSEEEWESHYNATLAYLGIPGTISKFQQNFLKKVQNKTGELLVLNQIVEEDAALKAFDEFWNNFPKKRENGKALRTDKAWCREEYIKIIKLEPLLHKTILKTIQYIDSLDKEKGYEFTRGTVNFLKKRTWEDYINELNEWDNWMNSVTKGDSSFSNDED